MVLEDGRYALSGTDLAIGSPAELRDYARAQAQRVETTADHAWWQGVVAFLDS